MLSKRKVCAVFTKAYLRKTKPSRRFNTKMSHCCRPPCSTHIENQVYNVVMLRHGQSEWSQRFCGWYNAELTEKGLQEAHNSGKLLKGKYHKFDVAYTSVLKRANITLDIVLKELGQTDIPIHKSWRLNERHYGALTGLDKVETADKYGAEKVQTWRRSYNVPPPPMEPSHPYYDKIRNDPAYVDVPPEEFPNVESLELTIKRAIPYWNDVIVPDIKAGKHVLIVAHGTSLRAIVKTLDNLSEDEIKQLNIPTGIPFVYTLDNSMKPVKGGSLQFLGDPEVVKKAMEDVKNQIKKKD